MRIVKLIHIHATKTSKDNPNYNLVLKVLP